MIDLEFLEKLIQAVDASSIDTIELERGGTKVRLSKTPAQNVMPVAAAPAAAPMAAPAPAAASAPAAGGGDAAPAAAPAPASNLVDITAPMVGTFYRSPAPDAPAYTDVGAKVSVGDTLCIIEAMKLMNELEAEQAGEIAEICVENGEPVEYGQVLFRIKPA